MRKETELLYVQYKPLLFSLAYRMLGSVTDAEDIVHDAMIAFGKSMVRTDIENPRAYLCKTVTNLCLNRLQSASYKREAYSGQWLPEPIDTGDASSDPFGVWLQKESLSTAYLLLVDQLTYIERAVFLLREVFAYDYREIVDVLDKSVVNCRKIYSRAKTKMAPLAAEEDASVNEDGLRKTAAVGREQVLERFLEALKNGDIWTTLELLSDQAVLLVDGGGKVTTVPKPIVGASLIAYFLVAIAANTQALSFVCFAEINGNPGLVVNGPKGPMHVVSFHFCKDKIKAVYIMANPDKIRHFGAYDCI